MSSNTEQNNTSKSILDRMKNPYIALTAICLTMIFTVKHSVILYFQSIGLEDPSLWEYFYTGAGIAVLDITIIILSVHGQSNASKVFSLVIFLINIIYFWQGKTLAFANSMELAPGLLWAGCFAYLLFYYGELFVSLNEREDKLTAKNMETSEQRKKIIELGKELEKYKKQLEDHKVNLEVIRKQKEEVGSEAVKAKQALEDSKQLQEKYAAALEVVAGTLEKEGGNPDTYRKSRDYWRNKYIANGLSPEKKSLALVKVDAFQDLYLKSKEN